MATFNDLADVADVVLTDVHRTTPIRLEFSPAPWFDSRPSRNAPKTVFGAIYLASAGPTKDPDAYDGVASDFEQVIFSWADGKGWSADTFDSVVVEVADQVASLIQVTQWGDGRSPSWPPCPEHAGQHPLQVVGEQLEDPHPDRPIRLAAQWRCDPGVFNGSSDGGSDGGYGPTAIPVGSLAIRNGLATRRV